MPEKSWRPAVHVSHVQSSKTFNVLFCLHLPYIVFFMIPKNVETRSTCAAGGGVVQAMCPCAARIPGRMACPRVVRVPSGKLVKLEELLVQGGAEFA